MLPSIGCERASFCHVKLLVQPGDSVTPLVRAINGAKSSVEILIFRFDRGEMERALVRAAERGVFVHALIAYTNRGGEKHLRDLEMRLLAAGVTVARTADDLIRYHGKMMIIDHRELYLLGFNYTYLDMEHSRSFGVVVKNRKIVQEAVKLFEADTKRQTYSSASPNFVVSPVNARKQLTKFIKNAKKRLLIYDPKISDPEMMSLLDERAEKGVEIRFIGCLSRNRANYAVRKMSRLRLHTRTMIRDRDYVFLGSQSLRAAELDQRREIGLIFRDPPLAAKLQKMFDADWEEAEPVELKQEATEPASKMAKRVAKAVVKEMPPVASVVEEIAQDVEVDAKKIEQTVKEAVKDAVKEALKDAMADSQV